MKLTLTPNRIKLLLNVNAGRISLNDDGEAILRITGHGTRKVTTAMDQLEFFGLVHVTLQDRTYSLTDRGRRILDTAGMGV